MFVQVNKKWPLRLLLWGSFGSLLIFSWHHIVLPPYSLSIPRASSVQNVTVEGFYKQTMPYKIQTPRAFFKEEGMSLCSPSIVLKTREKDFILSSTQGWFNTQKRILELSKDVHLEKGLFQVSTQKAEVNLHKKILQSQNVTHGKMPFGTFKATGFIWKEKSLMLRGPVSLHLKDGCLG